MNLEQLKKQARELLRELRANQPTALLRLRQSHTRWASASDGLIRQDAALHDAQFVIARENGFSSWPKLKAYAEPASESRHTKIFVADVHWLAERAQGLLRTRQSSGPAAIEQIRQWHPRFADRSDDEILRAPFTEADARLVYAREHGFETWADLTNRIEAIAHHQAQEQEPFLAAFAALQAGDLERWNSLLNAHPGLARQRGTNGNSLLNLAGSVAAKSAFDATPFINALFDAGAEANDANDRGWTPLHQAAYSNQTKLAALLLEHGADTDAEAHGSGGTPLIAALFWGHRETADLLAARGVSPHNLRAAAGLGNVDLVDAMFNEQRTLIPEASAARGFYRPHSGFPDWQPSNHPQEVLDEALVWASKSDRVEVLERLVQAGANINADPYRGTQLLWAAFCHRLNAATWLLDHGAEVNQKATFGGATHGQGITALHLAAQCGHLPMVQLLLERGADATVQDDLYQATAEGAATYFGQTAVSEYLRSRTF